jgi:hypothetical protein
MTLSMLENSSIWWVDLSPVTLLVSPVPPRDPNEDNDDDDEEDEGEDDEGEDEDDDDEPAVVREPEGE